MEHKKYDIIALGELNVDLILNGIDSMVEIGKEKFAQQMTLTLGSSTAIFAANAAALGAKVGFAGMIGRDRFGSIILEGLQQKGVDTQFVIQSEKHATGATIVLNYAEDRANVTYQGAMDALTLLDLNPQLFDLTRHIHISSIFMQKGLHRDLPQILALADAKGVTTSLDTQWDPTEQWDLDYRTLLPHTTVFMPNEKELLLLTHSSTLEEAIAKIQPYIHICVIKQGSRGSLLLTHDGTRQSLPAYLNTHVVDAIGAGDSFNAGFITQFVQGKPLDVCQRYGNMTGAMNTTASGGTAAFTNKEDIEQQARQHFGFIL